MSIAVLIPCKDGERTVGSTIESAYAQADVFVVDDGSSDRTAETAMGLGAAVLRLPINIGKAPALRAALDYRWPALGGSRIVDMYTHVCVVDDDVVLRDDYIHEMARVVDGGDVAVAEGWSDTYWPQDLRWNPWIAARALITWRLQLIAIPLQAFVGTRMWLTGAHAVYRSDVIDRVARRGLVFAVEDCDYLWQIQRRNLGRVAFARHARASWQQASSFRDLHRQHLRWYLGSWQVLLHHRLGTRGTRDDAWFALSVFDFMFQLFWPLFLIALVLDGRVSATTLVGGIVLSYILIACATAVATRKWRLLFLWPWGMFYDLLWRYFFVRGVVDAWRRPVMETGVWTSPRRSAQ